MSSIDPSGSTGSSSSSSGVGDVSAVPPSGSSSSSGSSDPVDTMGLSSLPPPMAPLAPSPSAPVLTPPQPLSLIQYAAAVGNARIKLQDEGYSSQEKGFLVTKDVWANAIGIAEMIRNYITTVNTAQDTQNALADSQEQQIADITPLITDYNASNDPVADQAAIDAMNTAITNYNNGTFTDVQYNDAVAIYNAYADAHNLAPYAAAYNAQADIYNAQVTEDNIDIAATNIDRAGVGLDPLPLETPTPTGVMPTQSVAPPAAPPSIPLIPDMVTPIPTPVQQIFRESLTNLLTDSGFKEFAESLKHSTDIINKKLRLAEAYRDVNIFLHRNILDVRQPPYASDAYVQENDQGSAPSAASDAAFGGGYTQLAGGLSSGGLSRVLGLNVFNSAALQTKTPTYLKDVLAFANIIIGQKAGLLSGAPGVLALGDSGLGSIHGPAAPSVNVLVSLGFASVIRGLINSQALSGLVGNLLGRNGVGEADLEKLTKTVTAGFQLSLIQQAILQVANSLGLPGSVAQVLGNVSGIPDIESVLGSAVNPNINDVIGNSRTVGALAQSLSGSDAVKAALNASIANGPYESSSAFSQAYERELQNNGLDSASAQDSAAQANAYLDSELSSDNLDQSLTEDQINLAAQNSQQITGTAINASLLSQAQTVRDIRDGLIKELTIKGAVYQEALASADRLASLISSNSLAKQLNADTINQEVLEASLNGALSSSGLSSALASQFTSSAELRASLYGQLVASGIQSAEAHAIAAKAIIVANGADPFYTVGGTSILSPQEIQARLQSEAYSILRESLDNPAAMSVARQLAEAVAGAPTNADVLHDDLTSPTSLLNLANDQVATLIEDGNTEMIKAVTESFRETMRPTEDLFYIVNQQNTPGRDLIDAMSLMNAGHGKHPSNYLQSIDMAV